MFNPLVLFRRTQFHAMYIYRVNLETPHLDESRLILASVALRMDLPAAVHNLDRDILVTVFEKYLELSTDTNATQARLTGSLGRIVTKPGASTTPLHLAHVCSAWRTVVMTSPSLWASLSAVHAEERDLPLFKFWIQNSRGHHLDLSIIQDLELKSRIPHLPDMKERCPVSHRTTLRLLQIAMAASARWRNLSLQLEPGLNDFFRVAPKAPTSLLEEVSFDLMEWTAKATAGIVEHFATSYPSLRTINWGECRRPPDFAKMGFGNLTRLAINLITLKTLYVVLPQLPKTLQNLSIHRVDASVPVPVAHQPFEGGIELPHLSSLTLKLYDDITPVFHILSLPSLSRLSLESGMGIRFGTGDAGWEALLRLFHRSGCQITSLAWGDIWHLPTQRLTALFAQASSTSLTHLRHLTIMSPVDTELVAALITGCSSTLPSLQSMEFRDCGASDAYLQALITWRPDLMSVRRFSPSGQYDDLNA